MMNMKKEEASPIPKVVIRCLLTKSEMSPLPTMAPQFSSRLNLPNRPPNLLKPSACPVSALRSRRPPRLCCWKKKSSNLRLEGLRPLSQQDQTQHRVPLSALHRRPRIGPQLGMVTGHLYLEKHEYRWSPSSCPLRPRWTRAIWRSYPLKRSWQGSSGSLV